MAGRVIRDPAAWLENRFQTVTTVEEAVRRYPDDPEIWYDLGDILMHWPPPVRQDPAAALRAFERAIALDSGFTPAYEHTVELAMRLGMPDRAATRAHTRRWERLRHTRPRCAWPRSSSIPAVWAHRR